MTTTQPGIFSAAHLVSQGHTSKAIAQMVSDGRLVKVRHGVYALADEWALIAPAQRHVALVRGTIARTSADAIVSHLSAAALHGLPLMRDWPTRVHVLRPGASGGSSSPLITVHRAARPPIQPEMIEGVLVTDLMTTLVDVAATCPHEVSVPMLDQVLRTSAPQSASDVKAEWHARLDELAPSAGASRAFRAIEFATTLSDSPAESLSRVLIARGGFAVPTLQKRFQIDGRVYFADFSWEEVIGEYDGRDKYRDPTMLGGRTPDEALYDEKRREDAIRLATGCRFVRWGAAEIFHPQRLWTRLRQGGVPVGR